ncbi:uncharacterized protein HKW66_Vig0238070 [Vigna angularis]|uniref:Uncharacterized protein n=1 Tax=Phaseolus angularis TaxID=3914 RepID=A0A8T0KR04_PHAAN|nr:uncharacterized protein HKW66_Vig0238070 [Vigna angularis]
MKEICLFVHDRWWKRLGFECCFSSCERLEKDKCPVCWVSTHAKFSVEGNHSSPSSLLQIAHPTQPRVIRGSRDLFSLCSCSDSRRKGESFFPLLFGLDKGLQEGDTRSGAVEARPRRGVGFWVSFGIWVSYTRVRLAIWVVDFGNPKPSKNRPTGRGASPVAASSRSFMLGLFQVCVLLSHVPLSLTLLIDALKTLSIYVSLMRQVALIFRQASNFPFEWRQLVEIGEISICSTELWRDTSLSTPPSPPPTTKTVLGLESKRGVDEQSSPDKHIHPSQSIEQFHQISLRKFEKPKTIQKQQWNDTLPLTQGLKL